MDKATDKTQVEKDAELIDSLGGPAKVADMLGFRDESGTQRVWNWTKRGIPSQVKLDHPQIFLPHLTERRVA